MDPEDVKKQLLEALAHEDESHPERIPEEPEDEENAEQVLDALGNPAAAEDESGLPLE